MTNEHGLTPEHMADFECRYARAHAGIIDDRSVMEMPFGVQPQGEAPVIDLPRSVD